MPRLPEFVTFINVPEEYTIQSKDDVYTLEEKPKLKFQTVAEAYHYVRNELDGNPLFAKNLQVEDGAELSDGMYVCKKDKKTKTFEVLMSWPHEERVYWLVESYKAFLKLAKKYSKNQNDFYTAYQFLQKHPAFWHRFEVNPNYWETDEGLEALWMSVRQNKKGKVEFLLEHGIYMDADRDDLFITHVVASHDSRIDSWASTYEKAIVKLAKKVLKYYKLDGSEKKKYLPNDKSIKA